MKSTMEIVPVQLPELTVPELPSLVTSAEECATRSLAYVIRAEDEKGNEGNIYKGNGGSGGNYSSDGNGGSSGN